MSAPGERVLPWQDDLIRYIVYDGMNTKQAAEKCGKRVKTAYAFMSKKVAKDRMAEVIEEKREMIKKAQHDNMMNAVNSSWVSLKRVMEDPGTKAETVIEAAGMILKGIGALQEEFVVKQTNIQDVTPEVMELVGRIKGELPRNERVIQPDALCSGEE